MRAWVLFLLAFLGGSAHAENVEIWSYAFVTVPAGEQQPIGGDGSAIFKPVEGQREGPMWSHDRTGYRLKFTTSGQSASAVLTPEKKTGAEVRLEGSVTETPEANGKGCSVVARLTNGVHYVLLQRYADPCGS